MLFYLLGTSAMGDYAQMRAWTSGSCWLLALQASFLAAGTLGQEEGLRKPAVGSKEARVHEINVLDLVGAVLRSHSELGLIFRARSLPYVETSHSGIVLFLSPLRFDPAFTRKNRAGFPGWA